MTMKESGITREYIIDYIISDIQKTYNISREQAAEYFDEALSYEYIICEIKKQVQYSLSNPERKTKWWMKRV